MNKVLKKNIFSYFVLNVCLIYFFTAVALYLGLSIDNDIAFVSPDSHTYYQVGQWLYNGAPTEYLTFRPFLFPFILFSSVTFLGIKGYFVFQFIFWIGSVNLLFASLIRLFNNTLISITGVVLLASNLTFLMLTFHGLSEVFVMFLTSLFLFLLTLWIESKRKDKVMLLLLFVLILLSVTKPVFFYFALLASLIIIPFLLYKYKYHKSAGKIFIMFLIFVPLFFQIGIMKVNFNTFSISTIGSETFRYYLFRRCYAIENNLSKEAAMEEVRKMPDSDIRPYILNHKNSFIKAYFTNLEENLKAYPLPLLEFIRDKNTGTIVYGGKAGDFMYKLNSIYFYLHIVFFFILFFKIIRIFYKKEFNNWNICLLVLSFMLYSLLLSSAISCDEGDRLVLPALPIWIVLYLMVFSPGQQIISLKIFTK